MSKVLIVEDDPGLQSQMRWCFEDIEVLTAGDRGDALQQIKQHQPAVVTIDLGLPPDAGGTSEGMALLGEIGRQWPQIKCIVITGREEREHALRAVEQGAYDFYNKPIDGTTLTFVVERALRLNQLELELAQKSTSNTPLTGLIAAAPIMLSLCARVEKVAPTDTNVLILGETGTGKEVIARNLHELSSRAEGPLVTINCAAIPENLLESELFGHEKGSFTGAHAKKKGKIEAANGGTLFLDEIGDMPLPLQAKILRFLQERTFEPVGATKSQTADVRVISATHQNLREMIDEKTFREDLYYRVGEFVLELPALRDRDNDVLLIANALLTRHQHQTKLRFSPDAVTAMEQWHWPGNIRELENRVKQATILADGNAVTAIDLELEVDESQPTQTLKEARGQAETTAIVHALVHANRNMSEAARLLGVSRPTLYNLIDKYQINAENVNDE